jgi:heme/copper-type cytochrome/quinol oxidase subunit 4
MAVSMYRRLRSRAIAGVLLVVLTIAALYSAAGDPSVKRTTMITMSIAGVIMLAVTVHALIAMRTASRESQP